MKKDPTDELYKVVNKYIRFHGGKLLVIGGVQILKSPEDGEFNFGLVIRCTGLEPKKPPQAGE